MIPERSGGVMLVAGAALGAAIAIAAVTRPNPSLLPLSEGVVAVVGERTISEGELSRAVAAVAADRRHPTLPAGERERVLERLIDEELLVQRAIELDLDHRDPRIRAELSAAAIEVITAPAEGLEPTEEELRTLISRSPATFRRDQRVRIRRWYFRGDDARRRALSALPHPEEAPSDEPPRPLEGEWLAERWVLERFGPTVLRALREARVGEVVGPFGQGNEAELFRLEERSGGSLPPLEAIRDEVAAEWRRIEADRLLRSFLRRRRSEVVVRRSELR